MSATTRAEFEARYRSDPDPWRYRASRYERDKYAATLAACGAGPFDDAVELGGSIGVFSAMLAPRCRRLTTIDFSATAVEQARLQLQPHPHAAAVVGEIPAAIQRRRFDLVVASEVLYYLTRETLLATLAALEQRMPPGGTLVCVHWRQPGPERPLSAAEVHEAVRAQPWLALQRSEPPTKYLLDVLEST
jgi:predicted O-methyltransferase YrrM